MAGSVSIYQPAGLDSPAFTQGLLPVSFTNTTVVFGQGSARSYTNDWVSAYPGTNQGIPGQITINTATIGANGVFPNALTSVTPAAGVAVLPVYLVSSTTGTTDGSLNALNTTVPALVISTTGFNSFGVPNQGFVPAGYDSYSWVGIVVINSSGNLVPFVVNGNHDYRSVMFQDAQLVLSAGDATTYTKVDLILGASNGGILPYPIVSEVKFVAVYTPTADTSIASIAPYGLTPASEAPIQLQSPAAEPMRVPFAMQVGNDAGTAAITYKAISGDTLSLYVAGFTFNASFAAASNTG